MTVSHWRRVTKPPRERCDLVVVGGGICGVSAALHAQRRGLSVTLIEKDRICAGASGRNAGFLMRGCADHYADAVRRYGRARARDLWRLTEENLRGLLLEGASGVEGFRAVPSVLLALDAGESAELRQSAALLREDGFDAPWIEAGDDTVWRTGAAVGALSNPHDASVNSYRLVRHLASRLTARVHEGEEVFAFEAEEGGARVAVRTAERTVLAPRVLVCTNAYAPLLIPELVPLITPRRGQMLAIAGDGLRLDASYYARHGSEYFRQTAEGAVVVGGCRTYHAEKEVGYEDRVTPWVQEDIERFASSVLGLSVEAVRARVTARWSGVMGFTPHGLPVVTKVTDRPGVWFCGGFTGHGMSMAYQTSRLALDAVLDGKQAGLLAIA